MNVSSFDRFDTGSQGGIKDRVMVVLATSISGVPISRYNIVLASVASGVPSSDCIELARASASIIGD